MPQANSRSSAGPFSRAFGTTRADQPEEQRHQQIGEADEVKDAGRPVIDEHHTAADERRQDHHPDNQQPPTVPDGTTRQQQRDHRQAAEIDLPFGVDERLPENEQADVDQPAEQTDHRIRSGDERQVQDDEQ
jgi:hypothetical protein